ncbi:MAG TPA: hypothetical protein VGX03_26330 [Candidatus Binatia bacterium]|jgi:hypothetical protein|nr:hypothetical protein [Candidatus Binatia bacterium]
MEDTITLISILASLGLGIYNLMATRRTLFVNTVTAQRMKWIDSLRENIAQFTGLTYNWTASAPASTGIDGPPDTPERAQMVLQIDKLRMLIKLQLNPQEEIDQKIIKKIDEIPNLTHPLVFEKLKVATADMISLSQALLKKEWEKVKVEAQTGSVGPRRACWNALRRCVYRGPPPLPFEGSVCFWDRVSFARPARRVSIPDIDQR